MHKTRTCSNLRTPEWSVLVYWRLRKSHFFVFFSITDNCFKATSSCQLCFTVSADVLNEER